MCSNSTTLPDLSSTKVAIKNLSDKYFLVNHEIIKTAGPACAVIFACICECILEKSYFIDDKYWTSVSSIELHKKLKLFSERALRRYLATLVRKGFLVRDCFAGPESRFSRQWYAVNTEYVMIKKIRRIKTAKINIQKNKRGLKK